MTNKTSYEISAGQLDGTLSATQSRTGHPTVESALRALVVFASGMDDWSEFATIKVNDADDEGRPSESTYVYLSKEDMDRDGDGSRVWAVIKKERADSKR